MVATKSRRSLVRTALDHPVAAAAAIIVAYVVIWTLAQALFFPTPRRDSVEIAGWAPFWPLVAPKHPPMPSWLQEIAFLASGRAIASSYALSMLALGATLAILFRFARTIAGAQIALVAVTLTLANYFFTAPATQFNHNTVSLLFGAATVFLYRDAVLHDRLAAWIGLGLCSAGLMLSKYSGALVLLPLAAHALCFAQGRARLASPGLYLAIGVFAAAMAPHVLRVAGAGETPVDYAFEREEVEGLVSRVLVAAEFLLAQVGHHAGLLVMIALAALRVGRGTDDAVAVETPAPTRFDASLVYTVTLAPLVLNAIVIGVAGIVPRAEWGGAYVFFSGLAVALLLPRRFLVRNTRALGALVVGVLVALPLGVVLAPHLTGPRNHALYPADEIAAAVARAWREEAGDAPLRYLVGPGDTETYAVAIHLSPTPLVVYGPRPEGGLAFDREDLRRSGAVILWPAGAAPALAPGLFGEDALAAAGEPVTVETTYHNIVERRVPVALSIYVVPPPRNTNSRESW